MSNRPTTSSRHAYLGEGPQECETLLNLFAGPTGPVHLGRCLVGEDDGRIVLLRRVMAVEVPDLESAIERARGVSSPQHIKVLGLLCRGRARYIASEYIEGVALWELEDEQHLSRVPPDVAARVIRDALVGASIAAQQMHSRGVRNFQRYIFPDTVWIGEFGSALLTEIGIAQRISLTSNFESGEVKHGQFSRAPETDVQAAALELKRLLDAGSSRTCVPPALVQIVERGLSRSRTEAFGTVEAMADALSSLPESIVAPEARVTQAMHELIKPTLEARRLLLKEVLSSGFVALDDPTASYRSSTARGTPSEVGLESDDDAETRLYRPRPLGSHDDPGSDGESLAATREEEGSDRKAIPHLRLTLDAEDTSSGVAPRAELQGGADSRAAEGPPSAPTEPASAGSREAIWRAIAIASLTAVAVLFAGRLLGFW